MAIIRAYLAAYLVGILSLCLGTELGTAQEGSTQIGRATVSIGIGTSILHLPDVDFLSQGLVAPSVVSGKIKVSEDLSDEIGWNISGGISVPLTGRSNRDTAISLNGFFSQIEDGDSASCSADAVVTECALFPLIDNPAVTDAVILGAAGQLLSDTDREVAHWGFDLSKKWWVEPALMGVTRAPARRYFALGAEVRGIDQDLDVRVTTPLNAAVAYRYDEELDTRYYGVYAAWGGELPKTLTLPIARRLGLQTTAGVRGGIYYADTDYQGQTSEPNFATLNSRLSLSRDDVAFIGGVVLETSKSLGPRTKLSLKSEYEYISYVPDMRYNDTDIFGGGSIAGFSNGTRIGDDDAFSARSILRLTIGLGPNELYE